MPVISPSDLHRSVSLAATKMAKTEFTGTNAIQQKQSELNFNRYKVEIANYYTIRLTNQLDTHNRYIPILINFGLNIKSKASNQRRFIFSPQINQGFYTNCSLKYFTLYILYFMCCKNVLATHKWHCPVLAIHFMPLVLRISNSNFCLVFLMRNE